MNGKYTNPNEKASELLEEIYYLWSDVRIVDENELRSPLNRKEIRKSRALLRQVKSLDYTGQDVLDRIEELENVINSADATIPKYTSKVIRAIVFSIILMAGLYFYFTQDKYDTPKINHNKEWFKTEKGGYLLWKPHILDKDIPGVKQKIYIKKGTELNPIASFDNWPQVETTDGQLGFIKYTILKGSRYIEAETDAQAFDKIGSEKIDTIPAGTKAIIIERTKRKGNFGDELYLKVKLDDGKIKWVQDYQFKYLLFDSIPNIEQLFYHVTNLSAIQKHLTGKTLEEFEEQYGPASSILKVNGKHQAYFQHLIVVDQKKHYHGILVNLDDNNNVQDIEYTTKGNERTYEIFPLVKLMRDFEIQNGAYNNLYNKKILDLSWWENFKDLNWLAMIIGWIVGIILLLTGIFLFFSIPRIIISPVMQIFTYNKFFSNDMLILISFILLLSVYYIFFVLSILIMDQWLIPALGNLFIGGFWFYVYVKRISHY